MSPTTVILLVCALLALKLFVWWLEPRMAFYPIRGVQETPPTLGLPFEDVRIPTADGETLHAWRLDDPAPRAQVIFWHGNGGNLSVWLDVIAEMRGRRLSVLAFDYRGYGASTGTPSERGLRSDTDAVIQFVNAQVQRRGVPLLFWGRSIGCTFAAYAAVGRTPDALVLESPMPDARTILRDSPLLWLLSFLSSYRFPTSEFLKAYTGPLLVIHGNSDSIIPYRAGRRVFDRAPSARKKFVTISGADHNDLHIVNPALYWSEVDAFLASLRPRE